MNKKPLIIFAITIIILLIIAFICIFKQKESRTEKLYNKLSNTSNFTFSMEKTNNDFNYKVSMTQRQNEISIDMYSNGEHTATLATNDNLYYINHNNKEYIDYGNQKIDDADIIINEFNNIVKNDFVTGYENIDGYNYYYEEYNNQNDDFIIYAHIDEESEITTRFYYDGQNLEYIKNIINGEEYQEELIKIDLKYEVDNNLFYLPKDYAELES